MDYDWGLPPVLQESPWLMAKICPADPETPWRLKHVEVHEANDIFQENGSWRLLYPAADEEPVNCQAVVWPLEMGLKWDEITSVTCIKKRCVCVYIYIYVCI